MQLIKTLKSVTDIKNFFDSVDFLDGHSGRGIEQEIFVGAQELE